MKILIVDDHPIFRLGIISAFGNSSNYTYFEASTVKQAQEILFTNRVDIALLDIDLPDGTGIILAKYICKNQPSCKIVFITAHTNNNSISEILDIEYDGFLLKENVATELKACIEKIKGDEKYLSPEFEAFLKEKHSTLSRIKEVKSKISRLTKKEKHVLAMIAQGKSTPQIAEELFNSIKTIENHRTNICNKLEISGSNNLIIFALENRELIDEELPKQLDE
ncbi:response regulator transcription factor [Tenuifilum thalassicum]|uniref:Response regulator transcription factor n=1 Tax=Tenuifilum thalassicum TaxID=2590900 RepID=A0A7D4AXZ2_9BACT|nr:response regulator transcription factor [Tenuifilum thalassicum]QKG80594.1 response regulator transcription factor [Tenuifilum thalassicum]